VQVAFGARAAFLKKTMSAWKHRGLCALGFAVFGALAVPGFASLTPSKLVQLAKITGPGSVNQTDTKYQVMATDLGTMWDSGKGQIMVAFGDTYGRGWGGDGGGPRTADWRCNVLARSSDRNPDDGLNFDTMIQSSPGRAKQLLGCKQISHDEDTVIPTAGVTVGIRHYIHYMSVNNWGVPGRWSTNYSGIAYSDDDGENWIKDPNARWLNDATWDNRFQMAAFVKDGKHVYMFGTPNGRFGDAYLARVPENNLLNKTAYQYWDGAAWQTNDEAAAVPIVIAPVSELSVQFNSHFGRWIMTYFDERRAAIILRDSPSLTGPWTGQKILVKGSDYLALYGGYIHPWFNDRDKMYFAMSQWRPYNVFFMRADLTADKSDQNVLSDPGFEDQTGSSISSPWVRRGDKEVGTDHNLAHARSGTNSAYLRGKSGFQDIYQDIAVTPNREYRLTGWVSSSTTLRKGSLGVRPTNDAAPFAEVRYGSSMGTPFGVYKQLTVDFNSGSRTRVRVFVGKFGPGSTRFDDLAVNLSPRRYREPLRSVGGRARTRKRKF
jgi:hypothetical protein